MIPVDQPRSSVPHSAANFSSLSPNYPSPITHYHTQLHPWCIIRLLPKMQRIVIARFRKRYEAEENLKFLQRLTPTANYAIVFDPTDEDKS